MEFDYSENINKKPLKIIDCGRRDFEEVLSLQKETLTQVSSGECCNSVLLVEHEPVITLGANQKENKLLVDSEEIFGRNISVVNIKRGGGTTAHNPGQLVMYPIIDLRRFGIGITEYIRELESVGIELLGSFGLETSRRKGYPGLWFGEKKIASIGVRVSKGVTYHGMAINFLNDLSIFDLIVPCGLTGVEMTSLLKEKMQTYEMAAIKAKLAEILTSRWSEKGLVQYEVYR